MRSIAATAALAALAATLAGCTPALPPESAKPIPAPPWTDPMDSVLLDADCSSGVPQACRKLAVRFFREGDEDSARRALSGGCMGASGDACWRWGAAFLRAERVHADVLLARAMFEAGCEGGSMKSCRGLYGLLLRPEPLLPDPPLDEVEIRVSSRRR